VIPKDARGLLLLLLTGSQPPYLSISVYSNLAIFSQHLFEIHPFDISCTIPNARGVGISNDFLAYSLFTTPKLTKTCSKLPAEAGGFNPPKGGETIKKILK
jgi:hypothetical protein